MMNGFDEFHGTMLLVDVLIDRRAPGHDDRMWSQLTGRAVQGRSIEFHECWMFDAHMNFGMIVPDHVRSASALDSDDGLERLRQT